MKNSRSQKGFTLIEILLVVAAIAILAGIVIVAINPAAQLAATRDAERVSEVNSILNAISQNLIDGEVLPSDIPSGTCDPTGATTTQEICTNGAADCTGLVDLETDLVDEYISAIPSDPSTGDASGTGYFVSYNGTSNRVTVCANPEGSDPIAVTR